mmetsp:Transcript_58128/g.138318  ORF Transcript_58128/g.138318 Transcript_58128/m.138318 type:complete len:312 (+) Transcript_58128:43-978(+)
MAEDVRTDVEGVLGLAMAPVEEWPGLQKPSQLDYQQFLVALGISPLASPSVLQVAQRAHSMPYPPHWTEEIDNVSGTLYFYHTLRDESRWEHPAAETFQEVLQMVEQFRADRLSVDVLAGRVEAAIMQAQEWATEELGKWVGPIQQGEDTYFYNGVTQESTWEDPRERWQYHLRVRYDLLVGYLVAEEKRVAVGTQAQPVLLQKADITTTLTSMASSMSSMASTLDAALRKASLDAADGTSSTEVWAKPRTPRFGCVKLPPRATGTGGKRALFSMPPHQQRYTSSMLHPDAAIRGSALQPPPPPPDSPARY